MTFIVRRYERGRRLAAGRRRPGNRPQGGNAMVAADGALAELIARKVGKGRAREIHGHGPLVFHLYENSNLSHTPHERTRLVGLLPPRHRPADADRVEGPPARNLPGLKATL